MRTTVTLDDDVYEAARAHAQATGKRLGRVLDVNALLALAWPNHQFNAAGDRCLFARGR